MAGYTYYYMFSIIAVFVIALALINLLYLKFRGKTTAGQKYKKGTSEYKRVIELARPRNLIILVIIGIILIANLINSISVIMNLNTPSARFALVGIPIFVGIIAVPIFVKIRGMFGTDSHK